MYKVKLVSPLGKRVRILGMQITVPHTIFVDEKNLDMVTNTLTKVYNVEYIVEESPNKKKTKEKKDKKETEKKNIKSKKSGSTDKKDQESSSKKKTTKKSVRKQSTKKTTKSSQNKKDNK